MATPSEPIRLWEVGPYADLMARPNPDGLVVLTVPPFETMLPFLAKKLGRELTPEEVEVKRRSAPSIVVTRQVAQNMAAQHPGYAAGDDAQV
jgi:hypothetical protein